MNHDTFFYYLGRYMDYYPFLLPLGTIGVWRWTVWGIKKVVGAFYRPKKAGFTSSVSIVTPVYNEDPKLFMRAVESWERNKPNEIIAVIDYTDKACIEVFKKFANKHKSAKLIITKTPGKREALADGMKVAKSEIFALIDSDTIWDDHTMVNGLAPFTDKKMGGVATRQSLEKPRTLAQKLFSIRLEQRYWDDIPFLARSGDILVCLSGRTAFYRRQAVLPVISQMVNEKFLGSKVISGEDKRLTYLIEAAGWKTAYQSNSQVYTVGEPKMGTYLNQQIRWTRNSWRADLRALYQRWVFRSPIFALYLIDRAIQPFTLLISPIYFVFAVILKLWIPVITILIWWAISRTIKMIPHLKKYPKDIVVLPFFIFFNFISAYIRIFALLSINTQGWITRWHSSRLPRLRWMQNIGSHAMTLFIFGLVAVSVYTNKNQNYLIPLAKQKALVAKALPTVTSNLVASAGSPAVLGAATSKNPQYLTQKYEYKAGDNLYAIAQKYNTTVDTILQVNANKITNWYRLPVGILLTIPSEATKLIPFRKFNIARVYDDFLQIYYNAPTDEITISGRGKIITLADIAKSVGPDHLVEESPGVWYLKSSLNIRSGITLKLNKSEVSWLKLASNEKKYTRIFAYNSDVIIDGVKITSWDENKKDFDKNIADGRSYILVKDGSRMDLNNSEIGYLGYARPADYPYSPYGISWRMSTGNLNRMILTGDVENTKFHNNYFGAYTFGATGMTWKGNEFYDNIRYGLDPHDDSNGFLVENNSFHDNGTHGLIFSKRCINNIVRNNVSYGNKLHGIMLHELSNNNIIENNRLYGNTDGVALDHSSNNLVENNIIYDNKRGIRADNAAIKNTFQNNSIKGSRDYGVYLYAKADDNTIQNNTLTENLNGIYIKTANNQAINNTLNKNGNGIYFLGDASQNKIVGNSITYSRAYGIYAKLSSEVSNLIQNNNLVWRNHKDIAAEDVQ